MRQKRPLVVLLGVAAALIGLCTGTTIVGATTHVYDLLTVARIDARGIEATDSASTEPSGPRKWLAPREDSTSGLSATPVPSGVATEAEGAAGLADDGVAATRSASTEWGKTVQDFQANGDGWSRVSAHAEQASGRIYRGGTSIEEVFSRGDQWLVRHRIYDAAGEVVHETFRPYAKFGS